VAGIGRLISSERGVTYIKSGRLPDAAGLQHKEKETERCFTTAACLSQLSLLDELGCSEYGTWSANFELGLRRAA